MNNPECGTERALEFATLFSVSPNSTEHPGEGARLHVGSATVSSSMERLHGFAINSAPANIDLERDLPSGFLDFYLPLHARFTPRQRELVARRKRVLTESHAGKLPNHLPESEATTGKWSITVP